MRLTRFVSSEVGIAMGSVAPRVGKVAAIAGVAASVAVPHGVSGAAPAGHPVEHCVVHVVGQAAGGRYLLDEPTCYPTLAEALTDAGGRVPVRAGSHDLTTAEAAEVVQAASRNIGIHFDGANRTGSSITVTGADCGGGYINLSSSWVNRISSTLNGCPTVNFWNGFDKTGSVEQTGFSSENLGALNNAANSIGYAS